MRCGLRQFGHLKTAAHEFDKFLDLGFLCGIQTRRTDQTFAKQHIEDRRIGVGNSKLVHQTTDNALWTQNPKHKKTTTSVPTIDWDQHNTQLCTHMASVWRSFSKAGVSNWANTNTLRLVSIVVANRRHSLSDTQTHWSANWNRSAIRCNRMVGNSLKTILIILHWPTSL